MLSRVAENLYWLGRYVERAENTGRIVDVNAHLLLDLPRGIAPGWEPLIDITGSRADFVEHHDGFGERNVVRYLLGDIQYPGSLLSSLGFARENARTIRDYLPREAWELLNELYWFARDELSSGLSKRGRHGYLKHVSRELQSLSGMLIGAMNHDAGLRFLTIGRLLERADMTTRIIDVRSASLLPEETPELRPFENIQWMSVLKSLTAYQMYRRTMQVRVRRADAMRFLLLDGEFPRAVYCCVQGVDRYVSRLPRCDGPRRQVARVCRLVQGAEVDAMAESNDALHAFIDELQLGIADVHGEIERTYFLVDSATDPATPERDQYQEQAQDAHAVHSAR
jgi:uncharacterized alpha-E superfamily protein